MIGYSLLRSARLPKGSENGPKIPAFHTFVFVSGLEVEAEIAESLGPSSQIFPFWRNPGGDRFDHDCRPRSLVGSAATSLPLTATLFTGR